MSAPCPSWCDGTHPNPGGVGNVAHVRTVNGLGLEWVVNEITGRRSGPRAKWAESIQSDYFGAEGLRQLAADAMVLAHQVDEAALPRATEVASSPEHPSWCNKKHQPGANPNRQHHLHTWRSKTNDRMPMKVELYPFAGSAGQKYDKGPGAFIDVIVKHPSMPTRGVGTVLYGEDLRTLAMQLIAIADAGRAARERGRE